MSIRCILILIAALCGAGSTHAAPDNPTCVVPSERDGGFQLTCELAQQALSTAKFSTPLSIERLPGGVGAVAFSAFTSTRRAEAGSLVAFSEGSLFNLARGKFGPHDWTSVHWVAVLGLDYGAVVVQDKSPWRSLADVIGAISKAPKSIAIGGAGTINGRDWMRAASLAKAAGVDFRLMRFVAFDGGGDCLTALASGHVQLCINDAATTQSRIDSDQAVRMVAVYSSERLEGRLNAVPTAKEQGFDVVWPVVRGLYMGPDVAQSDYEFWVETFRKSISEPAYRQVLAKHYLQPSPLVGEELTTFVRDHAASAAKDREPL